MAAAIFSSWNLDPWLIAGITIATTLYLRGARGLTGRVRGFPRWRPKCFLAGVGILFLALASPIDSLGHLLLWIHMAQHWLLIMVAAPLILLGSPGIPLLRGLPRIVRKQALGPFIASPFVRGCLNALLHPATGWLAFAIVNWIWHYPRFYGTALESPLVHRFEHASFLIGAMLFWWQIIAPWPWRARLPDAALVVYLLAADVQNTIFSAIVTFSDTVLYPNYLATAPALGWDALRDQRVAGAFMWTAGQFVMLPVAIFLVLRALRGVRRSSIVAPARPATSPRMRERFDLLKVAGIGTFLRNRQMRMLVRWSLVLVAVVIVIDGFWGPSDAPSNLAGTLPWTHWRGLIVIALLFGGNFLCMTCPLMAPRHQMRRWIRPRFRWPTALRSKWFSVVLIVLWLVSYEAFDLWSSPFATAMLVVGYFVAILVVDGLFRGASFCKWVCPIGQFHMTQSLVSPLSVSIRDPTVCATCIGHECIRGSRSIEPVAGTISLPQLVPGCELELFQPVKRGNLDCTFCLDCVDACPHGNVGILVAPQSKSLADRQWGSSIARIGSRADIAALLTLLTFGAFANAVGMTSPWLDFVDQTTLQFGLRSTTIVEILFLLVAIVVLPSFVVGATAWLSARYAKSNWRESLCRGAHALVPIGAAMWCVHWFYHLATGAATGIPVVQRAINDAGESWFGIANWVGIPQWSDSCCGPTPTWLIPLELVILQLGLLVSGWMVWRGPSDRAGMRGVLVAIPWWALALGLWIAGVWIVLQPMQMRGSATPWP